MAFEGRVRFMRRAISILLSATMMLWVILVDRRSGESLTASTVTLRALTVVKRRPIIYTFQEKKVLDTDTDTNTDTNANNIDTDLRQKLEFWLNSWERAGWDARILYLDDALRHPDFDTLEKILNQIMPFGHRHQKMGYYRWLAMASVGGGWLTDLSVFPLWPIVQIDPQIFSLSDFTVHCGTQLKPTNCLLSGSAYEWDRLSLELVESLHRHHVKLSHPASEERDENVVAVWSDNYALQEIVTFANPNGRPLAVRESHVLSTPAAIQMKQHTGRFSDQQCSDLSEMLAVRFAKTLNIPASDDIGQPEIAAWLSRFKRDCVRSSFLAAQDEQRRKH
mmetsp:Transcript_31837/g.45272  ORF Transcript_31837/g.45272 Transcript_31837/m.45272 type:complete len:336 (-) Transcript_31837:109-1116(-)